jgi:hypothetical protein
LAWRTIKKSTASAPETVENEVLLLAVRMVAAFDGPYSGKRLRKIHSQLRRFPCLNAFLAAAETPILG